MKWLRKEWKLRMDAKEITSGAERRIMEKDEIGSRERLEWEQRDRVKRQKNTESKTAWDHFRGTEVGTKGTDTSSFYRAQLFIMKGYTYLCMCVFYISETERNHVRLRDSVTVHNYAHIYGDPVSPWLCYPIISSTLFYILQPISHVFSTNHLNSWNDDSKTEEMPQALLFITQLKIWKSPSLCCSSPFWALATCIYNMHAAYL